MKQKPQIQPRPVMILKRPVVNPSVQPKKRIKTNHVSFSTSKGIFPENQNISTHSSNIRQLSSVVKSPHVRNAKEGETVMIFEPSRNQIIYKDTRTNRELFSLNRNRSTDDPLAVPNTIPVMPRLPEVEIVKLPPAQSPQNSRIIRSPKPGSSRGSAASSPSITSDTNVPSIPNGEAPSTPSEQIPAHEIHPTFQEMLDVCGEIEKSKEMTLITNKLVKYYIAAPQTFVLSKSFLKSVEKVTIDIQDQPDQVFYCLKSIVEELKTRQREGQTKENASEIDGQLQVESTGDPKLDMKIRKLNKALLVCHKKIEALREREEDWNDEKNSPYLLISRFEKRALQIFEKICEITGEDPTANRKVKKPIKFKGTTYTEFNKALQSFYNRSKKFPDFMDVLKLMEHCNMQYCYELPKEKLRRVGK